MHGSEYSFRLRFYSRQDVELLEHEGLQVQKRDRADLARKIDGREEAGNNAVGRGRGPRLLRLPRLQGQMRAAALAGCDSGMRQQGWQMTLSTKKGAALMMAAIDDGCCDWGDDKMVRLLMEEKVIGCSNMGEGGGSVQRRVVTRADREIASDWQWEGAVDDGKKGEMDKKTPDCRCFLQFIQVKIGGFLSTNLHDFLLASSILPERRHLKGLGHIGVGPIAIFSTFPATATFPLLTFFLYYFLLPTAALIAASDCSISAASPFCSSCPAFSVNLTGLRSSLAAVCGNLLAALIAGRASSLRSFAAPLPPSW
ncbi:hypothetical protein BHM03_00048757 [Ensete ventricosum]|nr:hypothetical protein BHM03_00048757 [Ensete ventricosum]